MSEQRTSTGQVERGAGGGGRRPLCSQINRRPCVYDVVSGDTMSGIASRFGVPLDSLERANPQIPDPNLIFPGDELIIPQ
jgi:hypothetical protein